MDRSRIESLANQLMGEHLPGEKFGCWGFAWMKTSVGIGKCCHSGKVVYLSSKVVDAMPDTDEAEAEIRDTILHEIAHAIVGAGHGHGSTWKRACDMIGCEPRSCVTRDSKPIIFKYSALSQRYLAVCGNCGAYHGLARQTKLQYICDECSGSRNKRLLIYRKKDEN